MNRSSLPLKKGVFPEGLSALGSEYLILHRFRLASQPLRISGQGGAGRRAALSVVPGPLLIHQGGPEADFPVGTTMVTGSEAPIEAYALN